MTAAQAISKAQALLKSRTLTQLIEDFEYTINHKDENIPTVRGWIMDELEARNQEAFFAFLDSTESSPRKFFL